MFLFFSFPIPAVLQRPVRKDLIKSLFCQIVIPFSHRMVRQHGMHIQNLLLSDHTRSLNTHLRSYKILEMESLRMVLPHLGGIIKAHRMFHDWYGL